MDNDELLLGLSILANILQVGSFVMNSEQLSNDDLMKALEHQNQHYLSKVLQNQKIILERLDKLEKL